MSLSDEELMEYHLELMARPQIKHLLDAKYFKIYPKPLPKSTDPEDYYTEIEMSAQGRPLVKQNVNYSRIYRKLMFSLLGHKPDIDIDFKRLSKIIPKGLMNVNKIYAILKKNKLNIYYRNVVYIRNTINEITNTIDSQINQYMERAFVLIQPHRAGIPQNFIIYKFLEAHGLKDLMNNIIKNTQWKNYNKRWSKIQ